MNKKLKVARPTPFCQLLNQYPHLKTNKFNLEDTLDMDIVVVNNSYPLPQVDYFSSYFRKHGGTPLPRVIFGIKNTAFKAMYEKAVAFRTLGENHITALKIYLGLQDFSIVPIFQAVYTKETSEGEYSVIGESDRYLYDTSTEVFVPYDELSGFEAAYQSNINIKHQQSSSFGTFIRGTDSEAVIYPFQTIYTLMYDNRNDGDEYILLTNALSIDKTTGKLLIKHSLLLLATATEHGLLDLKDKYANRSHLCPPGCGSITDFDIIHVGPTSCP